MKRRLEADLISIAHKILQLKNKSDIDQLFFETQKLYEKLAVLRFIESQYGDTKPTIGQTEMLKDLENYSQNTTIETPASAAVIAPIVAEEKQTKTIEALETPVFEPIKKTAETSFFEKLKTEVANNNTIDELKESVKKMAPRYSPFIKKMLKNSSFSKEEKATAPAEKIIEEKPIVDDTPKKTQTAPLSFKDLMGGNYYPEPQFVKVENRTQTPPAFRTEPEIKQEAPVFKPSSSINDRLSKKIEIDLNDQVAFVKHLFDNNLEDYNRALSQINTLETYYETKSFIDKMIKPDHDNWKGKTDYEDRFMHCIEKKFL